jgi:hypothetical protein
MGLYIENNILICDRSNAVVCSCVLLKHDQLLVVVPVVVILNYFLILSPQLDISNEQF